MSEEVAEPGASTRKYGVKLVRGPFVRLKPHPNAVDETGALLELCLASTRPLAADLFCGAGGLSLGLKEAGFEVVLGVDHDVEAIETHRAHHPGLSVNWDMGDPSVIERVAAIVREGGITLVAGGPPCQPFSRAGRSMMRDLVRTGRRPGHDRRRDLWESFLGVIELSLPPAVIMENVPDMALDRGMVILRTMVERLESWGYSVGERVLDSRRFGVPQFRHRLVLVALRGELHFDWPDPVVTMVSVNNAIGDLPEVEGGWRPSNGRGEDPVASGWTEYQGPRTSFQRRARANVPPSRQYRIYDHITRPVREDDALAFAQMDSTTKYSDLSPELRRYRHDIFDDKYKRLDKDGASRTITAHIAKDGYSYIHPEQDRTITVREAARLQTFPDDVRFAGPPSSAFRQIGNAVPPLLGELLGSAVLASLGRAQRQTVSTGAVAAALADWFKGRTPVRVPWLMAKTRWQVIQAELLWARLPDRALWSAWVTVRAWPKPKDTLAALDVLTLAATGRHRAHRIAAVVEAAHWYLGNPEALKPKATAAELAMAPSVPQAVADLAVRIQPGESEDPVLVGNGVLRVAARFYGEGVDQQNRNTDGRIALARMVGGGETSHSAHLALIELANGICGPQKPRCGECPLVAWCVEADTTDFQPTLAVTSPADRRSAARSDGAVPSLS